VQSFWKRFRRNWRSLARMSWSDRLLIAESVGMLAAARTLVKTTAQGRLVARIGGAAPNHDAFADERIARSPGGPHLGAAVRVGSMVERVARFTWWRSMCLEKALAARWMLRRRGIAGTIYVGMARQGEAFVAHAWLVGEGRTITGGGQQAYATLAAFHERSR
jgi:hypothetical protein